MRMTTVALGLAGAAAGLVTAVASYHHAVEAVPRPVAQESAAVNLQASAPEAPVRVFPPVVVHRVAPCRRPARPGHGTCVTTVHRPVVVYDPAPTPAVAPAAPAAPAPVAAAAGAPRSAPHHIRAARPTRPVRPVTTVPHTGATTTPDQQPEGDDGHDD